MKKIREEQNSWKKKIRQNEQKRISLHGEIRFLKFVRFVNIKLWKRHGDKQFAGI